MKLKTFAAPILVLALGAMHALAQSTAFDYQGRLTDNGIPTTGLYDFQFNLFAEGSGGAPVGSPNFLAPVPVTNGLFNLTLDFGGNMFAGADRWLEIAVRTNGSVLPRVTLAPRQRLLPVPYAIHAGSAGAYVSTADLTAARLNVGSGHTLAGVSAAITGGVNNTNLSPYAIIGAGRLNLIETDAPHAVIGGGFGNTIGQESDEATISGGFLNTVRNLSESATIAGGRQNTIHSNAHFAAIGGGLSNTINNNAPSSTIAGGRENAVQTNVSFGAIGGGFQNVVNQAAEGPSIGGGRANVTGPLAHYATVPGGLLNAANGRFSFAAGRQAKANHDGAFVWGDANDTDFASTAPNQFLIRASGGVGIGTASPVSALHVNGTITATAISVANSSLVANLNADQLDGLSSADFWKLGGNAGTTPGTHFLGTTDNQPLELKVNGRRAWRLEPNADSPNVIGGHDGNSVGPNTTGATIGGGGSAEPWAGMNVVMEDFGTISGGASNIIRAGTTSFNSTFVTIAGGWANMSSGSGQSVIGGGAKNQIIGGEHVGNPSQNFYSTIGGGYHNRIESGEACGGLNFAPGFGDFGDASGCTIGGGMENYIWSGCGALGTTIAGGYANTAFGYSCTIGGGTANRADEGNEGATVAGGRANFAQGGSIGGGSYNTNYGGSIAGGTRNWAAWFSSIAGGEANAVRAWHSSIGGGQSNAIIDYSPYSTISGGRGNSIQANAAGASIGGGSNNTLSAGFATIGGGTRNSGHHPFVTIGGGEGNVGWGRHAAIGGGLSNRVDLCEGATIGGGVGNWIWAEFGAIAPGLALPSFSVIGGGRGNVCESDTGFVGMTIAGGISNKISASHATIGGGEQNSVDGFWATVPGGAANLAAGDYSFAAGRLAKATHDGAFVWADSSAAEFGSERKNQFRVRATGGVRFDVNSGHWVNFFQRDIAGVVRAVIMTSTGAFLSEGGNWVDSSDRNVKENFKVVSPREVLDKVARLPVTTWNYKAETKEVRHIGPMAQDFHATFGVGPDDKHIAALDANGVALAAIQGLNQKVESESAALRERLQQKETEIIELTKTVAELKELVSKLAGPRNGGVK